MKTILITGGTSGIGKGLAMHFLKKGDRVIAVGSSSSKGDLFYKEAGKVGAQDRAVFLKADLSLVKENRRIMEEVKNRFPSLDALILCAQYQKSRKTAVKTEEGFEVSFGLYYLSRYLLSYGLMDCLEKGRNSVIINVCAPGMKGSVNWSDLQTEKNYSSIKAIMHGSRLNDLLGVSFAENQKGAKIKYLLYNPGAVQTEGAMGAYDQPLMRSLVKMLYKLTGKPVEKAIEPLLSILENPPEAPLTAYMQNKRVNLTMKMFDKLNAAKLNQMTGELVGAKSMNGVFLL